MLDFLCSLKPQTVFGEVMPGSLSSLQQYSHVVSKPGPSAPLSETYVLFPVIVDTSQIY